MSNGYLLSADTWTAVSHNTSYSQSLNKHFTIHFLPTRPITLACSLGVRWLTHVGSTKSLLNRVFASYNGRFGITFS